MATSKTGDDKINTRFAKHDPNTNRRTSLVSCRFAIWFCFRHHSDGNRSRDRATVSFRLILLLDVQLLPSFSRKKCSSRSIAQAVLWTMSEAKTTMKGQLIEVNGHQLHYEKLGNGKTVVLLLPGLMGMYFCFTFECAIIIRRICFTLKRVDTFRLSGTAGRSWSRQIYRHRLGSTGIRFFAAAGTKLCKNCVSNRWWIGSCHDGGKCTNSFFSSWSKQNHFN